ncbi:MULTISPECIES: hydrogenase 4 subunit F [Marichromatium]|uniref:Hydrogenase 4 subunit F n=1 Tax=Marichromatium gracile TaxID=1048 RepID=A0A4V2WAN0_MARGR|nr:hydrogenase 4 subunit F [Marichromatium gracile]KXX65727.1 hydrogenase 4 subunit F [Marichromatium gracile]MBK1707580.1 hydrogenase 4 subunit F [Marichromatium gracile]TCW39930.1 hydrogenase-4 component F [Marichromatium gracile]
MSALILILLLPLAGALALAFVSSVRWAGWINLGVAALTLAAALWLGWTVAAHEVVAGLHFRVDAFNVYLVVLTAFVGLTTAIFSRPYMRHVCANARISPPGVRIYHSMYQTFMLTMLVALTTDNLGVLWVAVEGATLATVLLVSLYRTPEAVEAAWKYFILCGVGIALALFGTVLTYFAAQQVLADPTEGLTWSVLYADAAALDPTVMRIAFVFLLVGYGTKVGLVPMHQWLPDAHSEGPTPMSAVLSGLLLNVALYAVVRLKMLVDGSLAATDTPHLAGALLMGFGLISFLVAGLFLHRQRDIKRMFSYSSIEHMGLMTFAFGLGGPLATFGALLHMLVHSLTKSAIFITVGHAAHIAGTQSIDRIRGLIRTQPAVGWSLLLGVVAIAGFPPFGVFASEFLLLTATIQTQPWLSVALLGGLAVACAGLFRHVHPMVYGTPPEGQQPVEANMLPVMIHLGLVLWLGLAIPALLAGWLDRATGLIAGSHLL